jgi:hypothetical protein
MIINRKTETIKKQGVKKTITDADIETDVDLDTEDDQPLCREDVHDFGLYDHEDGSVRNACQDCSEPADPEIVVPAL